MRLMIDLQGAQGLSRHRGIGRYCLSLVQGIARNKGEHEIFVALSGLFPDTIEPIRAALDGLVPHENIIVWKTTAPVQAMVHENDARRHAAELLLETVLASVEPDYILVASLFEGLGEDIVSSIARSNSDVPTATVIYDLIPLIYRDIYLSNPTVEAWYENKLAHARQADLLLAISGSARLETIAHLGAEPGNTVNISSATEDYFTPEAVDAATRAHIADRYGLDRAFVMYTGGIDHRKNIERLITAFAGLSAKLRGDHQLAIVCSIHDAERRRLEKMAADLGLAGDDLILTGYISDADLLACYRLCKLFVFPSWHEGFGLPALEAMKCGRAVIASDRSSLPEVVGRDHALFDPFDVEAMQRKIAEVLIDDKLRARLEREGLVQSAKFSWDKTARRAWKALEKSHARLAPERARCRTMRPIRRPRLAFLSPLPPEASGISDYSAELLPELARHYRIEIVSAQGAITDPWVLGNCLVRSVAWFRDHAREFDRILYHFGNSQFHAHMFDLLRQFPGVVVLHDFFLSGVISYRDAIGISPNEWPRTLLETHGWPAIIDRFTQDPAEVTWTYPCNLAVLQDALGVIVHSEHSRRLARGWYGAQAARDWHVVPLLRQSPMSSDRAAARHKLGLRPDDFVVCSFGMLGPMKLNDRLLEAWKASPLAADPKCHLVFVGQNDSDSYGAELERTIRSTTSAGRIDITGRVDMATFRHWLLSADLGVQLRSLSRGEMSAAVLDCMNVGMATIVNANGAMADLPADDVLLLDDRFTTEDLVGALTGLWRDATYRSSLGQRAKAYVASNHKPVECAQMYAEAIEHSYTEAVTREYGLGQAMEDVEPALTQSDWFDLAECVARSLPSLPRQRRLLVDVSELVQRDSRSGIQRVVRSILHHWLQEPPAGWIVEPVYAEPGIAGYRYARRFTSRFLEIWDGWGEDDWVEPRRDDIFIGLDLQPGIVPEQEHILQQWRRFGVRIKFIVYDLLPITQPEYFQQGDRESHQRWLRTITQFDGVVCISRAVADEFHTWLEYYGPKRLFPLSIDWFHLGADTENSVPTKGVPDTAEAVLEALRAAPSFLAVGTVEPRKGQRQILAAFDMLWQDGVEANLVIVGKLGWLMEDFARELREHQYFGTRLFWLEAISDEYLDLVYAASSHLVAASEGEGFGLPLIEADRHGVAILARDIPVFREVAASSATYFADSADPAVIAKAVEGVLRRKITRTKAARLAWSTWAQSAKALSDCILGQGSPYLEWRPSDVLRFNGNDDRLHTHVGLSYRQHLCTTGRAGFLIYGPYSPLAAGSYRLKIHGKATHLVGTENVEVGSARGNSLHLHGVVRRGGFGWEFDEPFTLDRSVDDFEIRVWVDADTDLSLTAIELTRTVSEFVRKTQFASSK